MARTAIVTDSTADLSRAEAERLGLTVIPLVVNWEGQTFRDRVDMSADDFYTRLRSTKSLPKTGAPSLGAFEDAYRALLEEADGIVSVHISGKLSGTLGVARAAAEAVAPDRIVTIDSSYVSQPLGWLARRGLELAHDGQSARQIGEALQEMSGRLRAFFILDTLEFLQRGGRIGRAQALAGTLLNVKPILTIEQGEVRPVERVRTLSGAMRRLVEMVHDLGPTEHLGVLSGGAGAGADQLEALLQADLPERQIERAEIGPVVGTYGGPGAMAACAVLTG